LIRSKYCTDPLKDCIAKITMDDQEPTDNQELTEDEVPTDNQDEVPTDNQERTTSAAKWMIRSVVRVRVIVAAFPYNVCSPIIYRFPP
jgi:hypothetical protein